MGCHFLLQGIFPTQVSSSHLRCWQILYHRATWKAPAAPLLLVAKLCLTLCDLMDCSMPGFLVPHYLPEFTSEFMSIESVMPSNHLILCCLLILLPSIFPRVLSSKSTASCGQSIEASASASVLIQG